MRPLYDESQRISQVDEKGTERGIFRSFTTLREVLIDGKLEKVPVGYIETPQPLGAGTCAGRSAGTGRLCKKPSGSL